MDSNASVPVSTRPGALNSGCAGAGVGFAGAGVGFVPVVPPLPGAPVVIVAPTVMRLFARVRMRNEIFLPASAWTFAASAPLENLDRHVPSFFAVTLPGARVSL